MLTSSRSFYCLIFSHILLRHLILLFSLFPTPFLLHFSPLTHLSPFSLPLFALHSFRPHLPHSLPPLSSTFILSPSTLTLSPSSLSLSPYCLSISFLSVFFIPPSFSSLHFPFYSLTPSIFSVSHSTLFSSPFPSSPFSPTPFLFFPFLSLPLSSAFTGLRPFWPTC